MIRRILSVPAVLLVLAGVPGVAWTGTAHASTDQLSFTISDAGTYAYKASLAQPVVQVAPKCAGDPFPKYGCDKYDHTPNCPAKVAFGESSLPPDPQPPANVDGISGGAGDTAGEDPTKSDIPQSSAIRLHRLYSDGALGRAGDVTQANGLASLQYVTLGTPPWNDPYSHTESDAFTNQSMYEERCYPDTKAAESGDYAHFLSHSFDAPETDHYSECFQSQCQFDPDQSGPTATHAVTQVHMEQTGGTVRGVMFAQLENLQLPGDAPFLVHELRTFVQFESDGTADGLKWQAVTSAQGVTLAGQPLNFPTGTSIELGQGDETMAIGLAGPYAVAGKDGGDLHIVAPGLFLATNQQTAFFAGAELTANFGRSPAPFVFPPPPTPGPQPPSGSTTGTTGTGTTTGTTGGSFIPPPAPQKQPVTNPPVAQPQSTLISKTDPPWAPVTIFAFGLLALLTMFLRWAQQFEWGRDLLELRPIRGVEWLYRAFVKT